MTSPDLSGVRAIVFDLDGTLIDSKFDLVLSVNATLAELGRAPLSEEEIAGYIGQGAPVLIRRALGEKAEEEECRRGLEFFLGYYETHKMDHTRPYPGVREALERLEGCPMAVLTNKPAWISRRILQELGLGDFFQAVYGGNSFATKKPDPLGMNTILGKFGLGPRETLLVGDSEIDVQTARNAGAWAASVTYGFGVHDRDAYPPDVLFENLAELPPLLNHHRR